jgi:uncharacterized membrane protein YccC
VAAIAHAMLAFTMVDRSAVSARVGVIAAVPVAGMLAIGTAIGDPVAASTMGAGAMLGGVAWRAGGGPANPPIGTMFAAVAALGIVTVAGSASGAYGWLHFALLVLLCLIAGLLTSLGRRGAVVGTQSIIAFVVFGRFPQPFATALGLAGLVVLGGAAQATFATVVGLPPAWRVQRGALADAYRRLAGLARTPGSSGIPSGLALDDAEGKLAAPALLSDRALMSLSSLVDEGRRMRLELLVLGALLDREGRSDRGDDLLDGDMSAALASAADVLELTAAALEAAGEDAVQRLERATGELGRAIDVVVAPGDGVGGERSRIEPRVAALGGQVSAAARLAIDAWHPRSWYELAVGGRPSRGSAMVGARVRMDLRQLRDNATLESASGRHAVRLAVVVAGTELLVQQIGLPRGYWAVVAAATVLRPEFGATFRIGAARMVGTFAGVVIATLIVDAIDPGGWGIVLVVGVLAFGTYAVYPANFAAGSAGMTALIVFLLHGVAPDSAAIALDRGIDTLVGGSIGLAAYAVWPTLSGASSGRVMGDLLDAQRRYLAAVLALLVEGRAEAPDELRPLARRARIAWSNAESVVAAAQAEPDLRDASATRLTALVFSGLRRLVLAVHTLRLETAELDERRRRPELEPLARDFDHALGAVSGTLRADRTGGRLPALRMHYREVAARSASAESDAAVFGQLDELVDATDSLAELVGLSPA